MEKNSSAELIALARGPNYIVNKYNGFIINGFKFHTKECEKLIKTQNSGVMVEADGKSYYGILKDILELDYYGNFKVVLFRCDWVDINTPRGLKKDSNGFILVNFSRLIHTGVLLKDDPFIFSSQARQVFYVQDSKDKEWATVIKTKPRDLYDMGKRVEEEDDDTYTQCMPYNIVPDDHINDTTILVRLDSEEGTTG